eukprot:167061-Chlamydomonas_euryale.AAC.1
MDGEAQGRVRDDCSGGDGGADTPSSAPAIEDQWAVPCARPANRCFDAQGDAAAWFARAVGHGMSGGLAAAVRLTALGAALWPR